MGDDERERLAKCDECGQVQTVIFGEDRARSLSTDGPCYACGAESFSPMSDPDTG